MKRATCVGLFIAGLAVIPASARSQDANPAGGRPANTPPPPPTAMPNAGTAAPAGGPGGNGQTPDLAASASGAGWQLEELSNLSNQEIQDQAEQSLQQIRGSLKRVTELVGKARDSKDVVQLNCVNEKLTQIKGLLRISEDASSRMYDAIGSNSQDLVKHQFTKIRVAHHRSVALRGEAEQCVGESSIYTGETSVSVDSGPDVISFDPTAATPPSPAGPPPISMKNASPMPDDNNQGQNNKNKH